MSKDYAYEDIAYTERFTLRVLREDERSLFQLSQDYVWAYECGGTMLYLTTEEAVKFVREIGKDVEAFLGKFSKKDEPLL